jgi:hypothetical protein
MVESKHSSESSLLQEPETLLLLIPRQEHLLWLIDQCGVDHGIHSSPLHTKLEYGDQIVSTSALLSR